MERGRRTYILGDVNDSLELVLCQDEERARNFDVSSDGKIEI